MKEIPEDKLNDFKTYISLNTWRNAKATYIIHFLNKSLRLQKASVLSY